MWISAMVFLVGSGIAIWLLTHFKLILNLGKHVTWRMGTVGFIALGFFAIGTPRFNTLVIDFAKKTLKMAQLDSEIQKKQELLTTLETSINSHQEKIFSESERIAATYSQIFTTLKASERAGEQKVKAGEFAATKWSGKLDSIKEYVYDSSGGVFAAGKYDPDDVWIVKYTPEDKPKHGYVYVVGTEACAIKKIVQPETIINEIEDIAELEQ